MDCQLNWVDRRYMDAVDHDSNNDVDTTNLTSLVYSPLVLANWPDWHTFRMLFSYTLKERIIINDKLKYKINTNKLASLVVNFDV